METIASISTPLGKGAISIIRMSGKDALKIAAKVFSSKKLDYKKITPRYMYLGEFNLAEEKEKCLMVYFKSPYSYTGEDLVEFQVHGGVIITQKILETLLASGARLAEAGEFSKRAFLNGKISLDEAESIVSIIDSESESELKASLKLSKGGLHREIEGFQNKLTEVLAKIEVTLDYPDEDIDEDVRDDVFFVINEIYSGLNKILTNSSAAKYIKNGVDVAIIGKTNVGKSSLLNALLGQQRAIVTDIEGTTRDSIYESIIFKSIKFNFIDTAGIRKSSDKVEKIGIEKSKDAINTSDIVLIVFDGSKNITKEDENLLNLIKNKPNLILINKSDLKRVFPKQKNELEVSAKLEKNIEEIKERIYKTVINKEIDFNSLILTQNRQIEIIKDAIKEIKKIKSEKDKPLEVIALLCKNLWNILGKITGNTENEDIINLIFSKFCLGK